ncbi:MAG: PAS domain-containing protein [Parvibaculaceae bacterium]|nr:PAS domain-containing protein [Parvibaculaceae bacterium]
MFDFSHHIAKAGDPYPEWVQDTLALPDMVRFFDVWKKAKGSKALPSPQDLPPEKLVFCMPNITVTEHASPGHIRYRLAGTDVIKRLGINPTDKNMLDFLPSDIRQNMEKYYTDLLSMPAALVSSITNTLSTGAIVQVNGLHLPMINYNGTPSRVLNLHLPQDPKAYTGPRQVTEIASEIKDMLLLPL